MPVEVIGREIVDALTVVREEFATEERMSHAILSEYVHLPGDILNFPVALLGRQEVDAQTRCNHSATALLCPVDGEGIELVASEIHHWEQSVHQSLSQPALRVLAHRGEGVPSMAVEAWQVIVLAHGRAAHLYPRLQNFHPCAYLPDDICYVFSAP